MSALDEVLEIGLEDYGDGKEKELVKKAKTELSQLRSYLAALRERVANLEAALRVISDGTVEDGWILVAPQFIVSALEEK